MTILKNNLKIFILLLIVSGCSVSPGMHMETSSTWFEDTEYVYIESINKSIEIKNINESSTSILEDYRIGNGDQLAITVWGLPEVFPISNINTDLNLRRVDSNGNIFFPYVGVIEAYGKTQDELRDDITSELSNFFTNPQLDVSIVKYNSQKIYILGEVSIPKEINLTDVSLSLSEAIGIAKGVNTTTGNGSEIFIIRQAINDNDPMIFRADISSPAGFIAAGNFYLSDNDIIYVNAKGTTRWNRVISQFFPFSSFLNSIDNLIDNN